jgi:hypothetical protein
MAVEHAWAHTTYDLENARKNLKENEAKVAQVKPVSFTYSNSADKKSATIRLSEKKRNCKGR